MIRKAILTICLTFVILLAGCDGLFDSDNVVQSFNDTIKSLESNIQPVADSLSQQIEEFSDTITESGTENPAEGGATGFLEAFNNSDRDAFRAWASTVSIANINQAIASLNNTERAELCDMLLSSNAEGGQRETLLSIMGTILLQPELGFYAEVFSYTDINFEGDGFYFSAGTVSLKNDDYFSLDDKSKRNTLMHECFHSFNEMNNGPNGALNEGSAIWVYKKVFPEGGLGEDFAEATYGTKSYYKVYMESPDYPLEAPSTFSNKLIEVYTWLSKGDTSQLPWWDDELLKTMYAKYYESIDRGADFYTVWLPGAESAKQAMIRDPLFVSPDRLPMPTIN